ncbi:MULTISPECIES: hypothetical protein [unclassified Kaistella]|uniref:hypothetical protein n=1 Tax=unclassified Kaistella TaxID=2762626 RepID=UPI002736F5F2|nr:MULTISPECIES: hypothetical protein [unclassified Kaistella]MDP2455075.1 hypothetical protein [Kaistella sp. SH11-4b]MDP2457983.1 hypothetical protein [Kaistella sp. SH40-3]MDP2460873.1 hypothetical protein [Kaistella sp. SH19-2b]
MTYSNHKKKFPNDVLVYIEEFDKINRTVLFDFYDSNEYTMFSEYSSSSSSIDKPTMILLLNYNGKNLQENTYYGIKSETISSWSKNGLMAENGNSLLISYSINLVNFYFTEEIFTQSVSVHKDFGSSNLIYGKRNIEDLIFDLKGHIKVNVRNVGQGNWNEIIKDETYIFIYDCGTDFRADRSEVRNLIDERITNYEDDKPVFVLSHWDKDHYHCLLGMTDDELSYFSKYIFRNEVPNLTCKKLYSRIRSVKDSEDIYAIIAEERIPKLRLISLRPITATTDQIVFYNSQYHKDRNISGLVLSLKTEKSSVIFSGDCQYIQLSECVLPHLNYDHEHYLIVPHHGGKCGKFIYSNPGHIKFKEAIISVGKNTYKHPNKDYLAHLASNFKNTTITLKTKNDILINLK